MNVLVLGLLVLFSTSLFATNFDVELTSVTTVSYHVPNVTEHPENSFASIRATGTISTRDLNDKLCGTGIQIALTIPDNSVTMIRSCLRLLERALTTTPSKKLTLSGVVGPGSSTVTEGSFACGGFVNGGNTGPKYPTSIIVQGLANCSFNK